MTRRALTLAAAVVAALAAAVVAHAASLGVRTETITTFDRGGAASTAKPSVTTLVVTSNLNNKVDADDRFTMTFATALTPSDVCSGWDGTTTKTVDMTSVDGTGGTHDKLQVASTNNGTCTSAKVGVFSLGHNGFFGTAAVVFDESELGLSANKKELTLVLKNGVGSTNTASVTVTYTADTAMGSGSSSTVSSGKF